MRTRGHGLWLLALLLAGVAWSGQAAETGGNKNTPDAQTQGKYQAKDQDGNWFTSFWMHDVGDTIYHGLKTGARKISHAFTGGSKEQDLQNEQKEKAAAKPEVKNAPAPPPGR
jgi:hypothetical protein